MQANNPGINRYILNMDNECRLVYQQIIDQHVIIPNGDPRWVEGMRNSVLKDCIAQFFDVFHWDPVIMEQGFRSLPYLEWFRDLPNYQVTIGSVAFRQSLYRLYGYIYNQILLNIPYTTGSVLSLEAVTMDLIIVREIIQ